MIKIESHNISGRLAGGLLISLVWLNKTSIPNFSFLGSLEVTQIYLPGWVGWEGGVGWGGVTLILRLISVPNWTDTELANWN